jgi:hypothetical protein
MQKILASRRKIAIFAGVSWGHVALTLFFCLRERAPLHQLEK